MVKASVCQYILSKTIPHLVNLFVNPDEVECRSHILLLLSDIVSATPSEFRAGQDTANNTTPLIPFKDELLNIVIAGLQTPSTRCPGLTTLQRLLATRDFLTPDELSFAIHRVNEILLDDAHNGDARYWSISHPRSTDANHCLKRSSLERPVNCLRFYTSPTA